MDRFDSLSLVGMVRSPTLIIHGLKDSLIPCSQGEALYQKLSAKKMMVCPAEMDHNTSLLNTIETFVLPMIQFFSLPDYAFDDIEMPAWAFPDTTKTEADLLRKDDRLLARLRRTPSPSRSVCASGGHIPEVHGASADDLLAPEAWPTHAHKQGASEDRPITTQDKIASVPAVPKDEPLPSPACIQSAARKAIAREAAPRRPKGDAATELSCHKKDASPRATSASRSYTFATPPVTPRAQPLTPKNLQNIAVVSAGDANYAFEQPTQCHSDHIPQAHKIVAGTGTNDENLFGHDAVLLRAVDESIARFVDSGMAISRQNSFNQKPHDRKTCDVDGLGLKHGIKL